MSNVNFPSSVFVKTFAFSLNSDNSTLSQTILGVSSSLTVYFDLSYVKPAGKFVLSSSKHYIFFDMFEAGTQEAAIEVAKDLIRRISQDLVDTILNRS